MKSCPDCGRTMKAVTARDPDNAWKCEYCSSFWNSVCDKCLSRECWLEHRNKSCAGKEWPDHSTEGEL